MLRSSRSIKYVALGRSNVSLYADLALGASRSISEHHLALGASSQRGRSQRGRRDDTLASSQESTPFLFPATSSVRGCPSTLTLVYSHPYLARHTPIFYSTPIYRFVDARQRSRARARTPSLLGIFLVIPATYYWCVYIYRECVCIYRVCVCVTRREPGTV